MKSKLFVLLSILFLFSSIQVVNADNNTYSDEFDFDVNLRITNENGSSTLRIWNENKEFEYQIGVNETLTKNLTFNSWKSYTCPMVEFDEVISICQNTTTLQDTQYNNLRAYIDNTLLPQQSEINNLTNNLTNCVRGKADLSTQLNNSVTRVNSLERDLQEERDNKNLAYYALIGAIIFCLIIALVSSGELDKLLGRGYS